jgi:hypothetical protein
MKVMKSSGLGVVEFTEDASPYRLGDRVRMSPVDAERFRGMFKEVKVEGVEMTTAPKSEPELMSSRILPHERPAIPDDWDNRHTLQRVKLAEQIAGRPVRREEADKIIKDELARRLTE